MSIKPLFASIATSLILMSGVPVQAQAQAVLTGDVRLACEAILCLSSSTRPGECAASLRRYFSINHTKLTDTLRARLNFLNLCPAAGQDAGMKSLVRVIRDGAGRCDAASLNRSLAVYDSEGELLHIRNNLPTYCGVYYSHEYTDLSDDLARYVGTPSRGGRWVEAHQYEAELAKYIKRIEAEDRYLRDQWNY